MLVYLVFRTPGADIVSKAIAEGIAVVPIPGANAAISALIASGLTPQPFFFYGFLNRGKKERRQQLEQLKKRQETILFYEAPHRLKETLKDMELILGNRRIVLARELTKKFEEFLRGTISEAVEWSQTEEIRGEFCIVLEGNQNAEEDMQEDVYWIDMNVVEHVDYIIAESGVTSKEAIKEVAKLRQVAKRDIYNEYHSE
ncbi:Ribosomal RNA small subunit methyltransferase I OS=Lysinibacillus sphaericus OX=1421 GN=rsmI PE=3 SV=1 [Lysinibacillus sphaericus]